MRHGSLALKLRVLRAERALTIEQAAERAGVQPETISDAERGRRRPYLPTLRKLAAAYEVPVEEILQEEAEPVPFDAASSEETAADRGDESVETDRGQALEMDVSPTVYEDRLNELLDRWEAELEGKVKALADGKVEEFFAWTDEIETLGRPEISGLVDAHVKAAAHGLEAVVRMAPFLGDWSELWRNIEGAMKRPGVRLDAADERRFLEQKSRTVATA